jgi:CubicO group peptidase (beta-lactamase class C family)
MEEVIGRRQAPAAVEETRHAMSEEFARDLYQRLEASLTEHRVAGASVAVVEAGARTTAAAGIANVATGAPVTPDTLMHIGSITKVMTATLVMQLVDDGLASLDAPIADYLPDLVLGDPEAPGAITLAMLLSHRSGIDGGWMPDFGHDDETIAKAIARYARLGQLFAPGTEFSYCNVGYVIAGHIVERMRGASWYDLVGARLFEPLGVADYASTPEAALRFGTSVGHYLDAATGTLDRAPHAFGPLSFAPAGSTMMMSASALLAFAEAHLGDGRGAGGGAILSDEGARAMRAVQISNHGKGYGWDLDMGLGWMISGGGVVNHAGGGPGVFSILYAHPASGWALAILTNSAHGYRVAQDIAAPMLARFGVRAAGDLDVPPPLTDPLPNLAPYVGTYEDVLTRFEVASGADGLTLVRTKKFADCETDQLMPSPPVRLIAVGDDKFLIAEDERAFEGAEMVVFRTPAADGRMTFLGYGNLHRRTA